MKNYKLNFKKNIKWQRNNGINSDSLFLSLVFILKKENQEKRWKTKKPIKRVLKLISSNGSYLSLFENNKKEIFTERYIYRYIYIYHNWM